MKLYVIRYGLGECNISHRYSQKKKKNTGKLRIFDIISNFSKVLRNFVQGRKWNK